MPYRKNEKNPDAPSERAIWRGSISFGLVQIPVGLYRADAEQDLHFTMLDKKDHAPVRFERKNSATGKPIAWKNIVRGFEVERGTYVIVTDEDFAQANVKSSGNIDILDFVAEAEVDASYFIKPYFLLPKGKDAKTYVLLREALRHSKRVGVAKIVLRTRQHLALVRTCGAGLMLSLLRFAHELRPANTFKFPPSGKKAANISEREMKMAASLVESMTASFAPDTYRDDYHDDLMALIARKRRAGGKKLAAPAKRDVPRTGDVVDIVALLQKSVSRPRTRAKSGASKAAVKPRVATKAKTQAQAPTPKLKAPPKRAKTKRAAARPRVQPRVGRKARRSGVR